MIMVYPFNLLCTSLTLVQIMNVTISCYRHNHLSTPSCSLDLVPLLFPVCPIIVAYEYNNTR